MKYECKKCKAENSYPAESCWCCGEEDFEEIDDDIDFFEADFMNDFGDS